MTNRFFANGYTRGGRRLTVAVALITGTLLGGGLAPVKAEAAWPAAPELSRLPLAGKSSRRKVARSVGRVAVTVGDVRLAGENAASALPVRFDVSMAAGDTLMTGADGRGRVELPGGDFLHIGNNSLLRLEANDNGPVVRVWRGELTAYGLPTWQGGKKTIHIVTPSGRVDFRVGKLGMEVGGNTKVMVYDNLVRWSGGKGDTRHLGAGERLTTGWGASVGRLEKDSEQKLTTNTSPEVPLLKEGLAAFSKKEYSSARSIFRQVQKAYPFNAQATYHLGLIHLKRNNLHGAISQWERYARIDPKGAKEKDIQKKLTLLISKRMKAEVKKALSNEKQLSSEPPVPNSIAVVPYENKGAKDYAVLAKGITAMIVSDLAKVPGVKVLERAKIQKLVDEIKLSQSGLVAEDTSVRTGKILKAEKMVLGNYAITKPKGSQ